MDTDLDKASLYEIHRRKLLEEIAKNNLDSPSIEDIKVMDMVKDQSVSVYNARKQIDPVGAYQMLPVEYRDYEMSVNVVKSGGNAIQYVPEHFMDENLIEKAIQRNSMCIQYIPEEKMSESMYKLAVEGWGAVIEHIPEHRRSKLICNSALNNMFPYDETGNATIVASMPYYTEAFQGFKMLLDSWEDSSFAYWSVHPKFHTNEMVDLGVKVDPRLIRSLEDKFKTKKRSKQAVKLAPSLLPDIPEKYKTKRLCREALLADNRIINAIPEKYHTQRFFNKAVKKSPLLILTFPPKFQRFITPKMADDLVNLNKSHLLSRVILYPEVLIKALSKITTSDRLDDFVKHIKPEIFKGELAQKIIERDPKFISWIPLENLDDSLIKAVINKKPELISAIPKSLLSVNKCIEFAVENKDYFKNIPEEFLTESFFERAVKTNPRLVFFMDAETLSKYKISEVCMLPNVRLYKGKSEAMIEEIIKRENELGEHIKDYINNMPPEKRIHYAGAKFMLNVDTYQVVSKGENEIRSNNKNTAARRKGRKI